MKLVFLYGPPAVGKLTVARELSLLTEFPVFHNHLVVDAVQAVFPFGSRPFVELREDIWLAVMRRASIEQFPGLIFTFTPERTVRPGFAARLEALLVHPGDRLVFIELTCPELEIERRIEAPSRGEFQKLASLDVYREARDSGAFQFEPLPKVGQPVDTSIVGPKEAASLIAAILSADERGATAL